MSREAASGRKRDMSRACRGGGDGGVGDVGIDATTAVVLVSNGGGGDGDFYCIQGKEEQYC